MVGSDTWGWSRLGREKLTLAVEARGPESSVLSDDLLKSGTGGASVSAVADKRLR
jgi:hypothetical protein